MESKYLRVVGEDWDSIREQFSEEEKAKLREAVTSMAVCPRLVTINKEQVSPELLKKLETSLTVLSQGRSKSVKGVVARRGF